MGLADFKGIVRNLTQSSEERAVARALQAYAKGQVDRAVTILKEGLSRAPDDPGLLMELGRMQTYAQRPLDGAEAFRSLLRRDAQALARVNEAIEEMRARHAPVGPLHDAVAEHHVRHDAFPQALAAFGRMRPEDLRAVMPRYATRWEQGRRKTPEGRLTRTALLPGYQLALLYETLRENDRAVAVYREIARANPDEAGRVLPRLEALAAREYQNVELRIEVASMLLDAGRPADAARQFSVALETNPQAARPVAERLALRLAGSDEHPDLRWILATALLTAGDAAAAIEALRPLVAAGAKLDDIISVVQPLASRENALPAQLLLAEAYSRRGQAHQALETLLTISEEKGLRAVYEPLRALAVAHPDLARLQQMLCDAHLEAGRVAEAIAALTRAHASAPRETAALRPRLLRAIAADRTSPEAHLMLADVLRESGDGVRAVLVLRHLVREAPSAAAPAHERLTALAEQDAAPRSNLGAAESAMALQRWPEALARLEVLAAAHPEMSAEFLHAAGVLVDAAPDLAGRLVALFEALEPRSPLPLAVRFARATALHRAGDTAPAATAFREILQAAPERAGEVRAALERFDRTDPRAAEARYLLASMYVDERDHEAALTELTRPGPTHADLLRRVLERYEALVASAPDDIPARCALLKVLLLAREFDRVIEIGRQTLRLRDDATTAGVSMAIADALGEKGDGDGAVRRWFAAYRRDTHLAGEVIARLRRLIDLEGRHPFACLALGKLLAQEGRPAEAVQSLLSARAADPALSDSVVGEMEALARSCPGDAQPGLALIALLRDSGQPLKAIPVIATFLDAHPESATRVAAHLDEILKIQPDHPLAQYELGRALRILGANARAADRFRAAAGLDDALAPMALRRLHEILIAEPGCTAAWLASADLLAARGQALQAAERLAEAIARDPGESAALLNRLEELCRGHAAEGSLAILFAEACARAGQHERAARAYGEAVDRDLALAEQALLGLDAVIEAAPRLAEAWLFRARARLRLSRNEPGLRDFAEAVRLAPRLLPDVLREVEAIEEERSDWADCTLLRADLLAGLGRSGDAEQILIRRLPDTGARPARLQMLLRLARLAADRQDEAAARERLGEAAGLAGNRNEFLARAHDLQVSMLRRRAEGVRAAIENHGRPQADSLAAAVRACTDLGDLEEARDLLARHADGCLDGTLRRALQAAIDLRGGDYARAAEQLRPLGPSAQLAFGALRAGDLSLAVQTLEALVARDGDPRARDLLTKAYHQMVAADLLGGSRRLAAETTLRFGEGAAA